MVSKEALNRLKKEMMKKLEAEFKNYENNTKFQSSPKKAKGAGLTLGQLAGMEKGSGKMSYSKAKPKAQKKAKKVKKAKKPLSAKQKKRNEMVKKVMNTYGLGMIEASKVVKQYDLA